MVNSTVVVTGIEDDGRQKHYAAAPDITHHAQQYCNTLYNHTMHLINVHDDTLGLQSQHPHEPGTLNYEPAWTHMNPAL